jgi:predicted RNase H-like nuclease (RuvC/YqgF family)
MSFFTAEDFREIVNMHVSGEYDCDRPDCLEEILNAANAKRDAELERLRAENELFQGSHAMQDVEEIQRLQARVAELEQSDREAADMRREIVGYRADNARLQRDLLEANCRADRLREALEHIAGNMDDSSDLTYCALARAALAGGEGKG